MKFTISAFTAVVVASSFVGSSLATSARPVEKCGSDSKILNSTTVQHNGKEIKFTTATCPDIQKTLHAKRGATSLTKRQISVCANGGCEIECADTGEQPFISDCQTVADYLEGLYPQSFIVEPGTYAWVSSYTCAFAFLNEDVVDYNVCYSEFGLNGIIAADDCFADWPATTATPGALCVTPGFKGNDWDIEIYNPE
ncbi:hypothetical protein EVG20_g4754 [Dentipellis fragilis]|uniref:Uncharacterized protein n=1 Tax=Dentipellis fragilis TaxID=205917 RepID=A0A4Y9YX48_9AGAM|nr:hypothetical protein EVG20_g4754 [Dentipellis fragilis]